MFQVNVDFSEATAGNNFQIESVQFDYRQTLATIMQDFLGSNTNNINNTFVDNFNNDSFAEQKIQNLVKTDYAVQEDCLDQSLSIEKLNSKDWFVYPNPFQDHVNLNCLYGQNQPTTFIIVNQIGQTIQRGVLKLMNGYARIDLPNLPTGLYVLTLENSSKKERFKLLRGAL